MFGFGKKKELKPTVYQRKEHCISRKNIDADALRVLYRLNQTGHIAYLVGGGVRDLLLGREPKDFDVGTSARPNEVKRIFRNCYLIGRRFRLAQVCFGKKVIETATFRKNAQSVGEIIEKAAEGPLEDNEFGTPQTDAFRRDFTVNGLFYNIKDFTVIDWVGGMKDLKKKIIRSIGDPSIRFREDPVRMLRAIKFSARLGFKIERETLAAIKKYHSAILTAAIPRVTEEIFRLFTYGHSEEAFRLLWETGLMGDLIPELAEHITKHGGKKCDTFRYLKGLDKYELMMREKGFEPSNALRMAILAKDLGEPRTALKVLVNRIHISKAIYFSAVMMQESVNRLGKPPTKFRQRFIYNRDFPDALDYNRIVARCDGKDESALNAWSDLYQEKGNENE
jgi:poly(A) polymerase